MRSADDAAPLLAGKADAAGGSSSAETKTNAKAIMPVSTTRQDAAVSRCMFTSL
jgi:hypothetical protein